ncbi:hypothetical protein ACFYXH_35880 [Streptomyces sp. NPDC002730]|uniref:hypothetical protein n=1 Tax=Streptomyces sp. NPDC002730 TaxID=3364662 RepID=UPI0036C360D3
MAAMTPAASADEHGDLERVSYVLPLGIATPDGSLTANAIRALGEKAELVGGGMTALETVGPVASYAPRAVTASAAATPVVPRVRTAAPAAVSYPAPARSISLAECQAKIDRPGGEKFYVKSRFAVCTGIRMTSTWTRNGAPVGSSEAKVFIRGTVRVTCYLRLAPTPTASPQLAPAPNNKPSPDQTASGHEIGRHASESSTILGVSRPLWSLCWDGLKRGPASKHS